MRRRRVLHTLGIGGIASLAGCSSMLENDNSGNNGNGSETEEPDPEYEEVSDYETSVNAEESDSYTFAAGVERSLDGETELLSGEITDAYIIRDNENYSDEILEEAGLYNELVEEVEQENGDGEYTLPTDQLLPGNNILHVEMEVEDEEHDYSETLTFEKTITVDTDTQQIIDQTLIEDRDIFQTLREQHREEELGTTAEYGDGSEEDTTWMDVAEEDVPERMEEYEVDMDEAPMEERLNIIAGSWNHEAANIIGGGPSGQANYLAYTLEEHEDVETTVSANEDHRTVLAYSREEDKLYHVETGMGGATTFPPKNATFPSENPELSPIAGKDTEENINRAITTLKMIGQVTEYEEITNNSSLSNTIIETGMERLGEGTNQETMINTMQQLGTSAALSPEINYEVSGDVNDPEISAELS